jgi:DNA-binding response OmpR family regulator
MSNERVLVIEDDQDIIRAVRAVLRSGGLEVLTATDGRAGLRLFHASRPAAIVLDIGLPVLDGWTVLDRIRDLSEVPVLLLTSHAQEAEKVRGLRAGADDYVSKPFGNAELLARVEALLRRAPGSQAQSEPQPQPQPEPEPGVYDDGLVQVGLGGPGGPGGGQAGAGEVSVQGRPVRLTPTEYRLLTALVRHPSQVLSPDQLLAQAWQDPAGIGPDRVKFAVMRLRRKLGPDGAGRIEAVRGFGYRYRPPAT